jgi:DNA-binding XRE family transcriptional regulator
MGATRWEDIKHKASPARRAELKAEAVAELDRMGYAAVRKAREMTQVELAERLGISQASVAGIESRTDLQLSTLAKYIRALGGELVMQAVFPEASFNLAPLPLVEIPAAVKLKPARAAKRIVRRVAKAS